MNTGKESNEEENKPANLGGVMNCWLSESELHEREVLLRKQRMTNCWFSEDEHNRLMQLSNKMFANSGSPHSS
jgi:hypothetical protein